MAQRACGWGVSLAARSRAQREAVRHGWDPVALRTALEVQDPRQDRLF